MTDAGFELGRPFHLGAPRASARVEYERRQSRAGQQREDRFGRHLSTIVKAFEKEKPSTLEWKIGAEADERVGASLSQAIGDAGVVLHDRRIPGKPSNIDHIAVVPTGVWVIDTKQYKGRVEGRSVGFFSKERRLFINGRDQSPLVSRLEEQLATVRSIVGPEVALQGALCFDGAEWGLVSSPFILSGIRVMWPHYLASELRQEGPVAPDDIDAIAAHLGAAMPPR
jgi:hypothetical protein